MSNIVHEFTIYRRIRGEDVEIELKATFEIQDQIDKAQLEGQIFLVDGGLPWDGRLTKRELSNAENEAYEAWDGGIEGSFSSGNDDSFVVDGSFDTFDDDMAIRIAGQGEVDW